MTTREGAFRDDLGRKVGVLLLVALLVFSAYLRRYALWMPHWTGDQNQYITLALKLDKLGLDHYNLRGIKLGMAKLSEDPPVEIVYSKIGDPSAEGDILAILRVVGQSYWDEPLHMRAPLYPYVLMWSHRIFERDNLHYTSVSSHLGPHVRWHRPPEVLRAQLWVAGVSLAFNLLVVLVTGLIGWRLFGARCGAVAAYAMAVHPVSLMTAHRALAEDPLVLFSALSFWAVWAGGTSWAGAALAGGAMGLAVLTKQSALYLVPAVWIYWLLTHPADRSRWQGVARSALDARWLTYLLALAAVTAFWFVKVHQVYGEFFHVPTQRMIESVGTDRTGWFEALRRRPHPLIFFSIGTVLAAPLFGCALLTLGRLRSGVVRLWQGRSAADPYVLLWSWVIAAYAQLTRPWQLLEPPMVQEHRYFYPAYPALAALAAAGLLELSRKWPLKPAVRDAIVCAVLLAAAIWSVPQGLRIVYENEMLF
ncbi:MAG: hypothetical protein MOGMAGMI_00010 [Candidatus Omnitrophica bacterium]|nr:hypothetical protein [Candidatus Omnitrophota bacterium]